MGLFDKLFGNKGNDVKKPDEKPNKKRMEIDEKSADEFDEAFKKAFEGMFPKRGGGDIQNFTPKGKFGYELLNPIMVTGLAQERVYLNQLECENGDEITYDRVGSAQSGVAELPRPVDAYNIKNAKTGEEVAVLYIYAYSHGNSVQAPEGFRFK